MQPMRRKGKGGLGVRCDYIGSSTNLVGSYEFHSFLNFVVSLEYITKHSLMFSEGYIRNYC